MLSKNEMVRIIMFELLRANALTPTAERSIPLKMIGHCPHLKTLMKS